MKIAHEKLSDVWLTACLLKIKQERQTKKVERIYGIMIPMKIRWLDLVDEELFDCERWKIYGQKWDENKVKNMSKGVWVKKPQRFILRLKGFILEKAHKQNIYTHTKMNRENSKKSSDSEREREKRKHHKNL